MQININKSVCLSQKILNMQCITKTNRLSLFGEIITVYAENYRTHINTVQATGRLYLMLKQ
jgi:hypothetical protein